MTTAANPSSVVRAEIPNDLAAFWMPFTPNRAFKKRPRLVSRRQRLVSRYHSQYGKNRYNTDDAGEDAHRPTSTPVVVISRTLDKVDNLRLGVRSMFSQQTLSISEIDIR